MSYDALPEVRCQCGHLATDHLWTGMNKIKRCQKKKCHCLKFVEIITSLQEAPRHGE